MTTKLKVRSMVTAPKDYYLLQADFSQAEAWVVAFLAQDPKLKHYLQFSDVHSETAFILEYPHSDCQHDWISNDKPSHSKLCTKCKTVITYEQRTLGKRSNHGNNYKMSHYRWAEVVNAEGIVHVSHADAKRYQDIWLSNYNRIPAWWDEVRWILEHNNRTIRTTYGRERMFFGFMNDDLHKEAIAYEPQSTVADHANGIVHPELGITGGFLSVFKKFGKGKPCWVVNCSHDSVILEVPRPLVKEIGAQVQTLLQRPMVVKGEEFTIPVDLEYGERWGEFESLTI